MAEYTHNIHMSSLMLPLCTLDYHIPSDIGPDFKHHMVETRAANCGPISAHIGPDIYLFLLYITMQSVRNS